MDETIVGNIKKSKFSRCPVCDSAEFKLEYVRRFNMSTKFWEYSWQCTECHEYEQPWGKRYAKNNPTKRYVEKEEEEEVEIE